LINPRADEKTLRYISYLGMIVVAAIGVLVNLRPLQFLQVLVVFSGTGGAATFVIPALMACYWRRATAAGCIAAMLPGAGGMLTLFTVGVSSPDPGIGPASGFRPYYLLGLEPVIWGLLTSAVCGIGVSLLTQPPSAEVIDRLFNAPALATEH